MKKILNYLATAAMILLFSGIVAGWTTQAPAAEYNPEAVTRAGDGEQLYSMDSIRDWMFMRQSESSNVLFKNRVNIFKYPVNPPQAKPANRLMQTTREGMLAHACETEISHSSKERICYYIISLRRIII